MTADICGDGRRFFSGDNAVFRAVQQNLTCSSPTSSAVLAIPSGRGTPHPPGDVVTDKPGADALFTMWLTGQ